MKRTTIKLSEELDARLRFEAERRGVTVSQLTREAIAAYIGEGPVRRLRAAGAGNSGLGDLASRIDHYLREDRFGEDAWS